MKSSSLHKHPLLYSLLSALGFILLTSQIDQRNILQLDHRLLTMIQRFDSPMVILMMKFFALIGNPLAVGILLLYMLIPLFFLYHVLTNRRDLFVFLTVIVGSAILDVVLKYLIQRNRPDDHQLVEATGYSYPGGHAMTSLTLYGVFAYLLWSHIRTRTRQVFFLFFCIIMIGCVGSSGVFLGVHYATDVLGGYLAGIFWLGASFWFFKRNSSPKQSAKD